MRFDKVPEWAAWLAQDEDGTWHPQGAGRGCRAAKAPKDSDPLHTEARARSRMRQQPRSGAYEVEPNKQDRGGYENEVGRIKRPDQTAPPADREATLTRLESR